MKPHFKSETKSELSYLPNKGITDLACGCFVGMSGRFFTVCKHHLDQEKAAKEKDGVENIQFLECKCSFDRDGYIVKDPNCEEHKYDISAVKPMNDGSIIESVEKGCYQVNFTLILEAHDYTNLEFQVNQIEKMLEPESQYLVESEIEGMVDIETGEVIEEPMHNKY